VRLYDVSNKHRTGFFVVARTPERAAEVAVELGHARELASCKTADVTELYRNDDGLRDLMSGNVEGQVGKQMMPLNVREMMLSAAQGKPIAQHSPRSAWVLIRYSRRG
jgi:hypothetical protein